MIETLARKRINLVALGALLAVAALVASMFVTLAPARAATGDVSAASGYCTLESGSDPENYRVSSEDAGTAVTVEIPDRGDINGDGDQGDTALGEDSDEDADNIEIPCSKANAGQFVKITPNGTGNPTLEILTHEVVVSFAGDAKAGEGVGVQAYVKNALAEQAYATIEPATAATLSPTVGASLVGTTANDTTVSEVVTTPTPITTLVLLPSASGEYTVTVSVSYGTGADTKYISGQASVTVGEATPTADKKVASAVLELDYVTYDLPLTSKNEGVRESGTVPASGGDIWLKLTIFNDLDKPAANTDLTAVTVIGPNGTIGLYAANAANTQRDEATQRGSDGTHAFSHTTAAEITHTMYIKVESAEPNAISVYALVNGKVRSDTVDLVFTGATSAIEVTDATKTLASKDGSITFTVTGMDAAGNGGTDLSAGQVSARIFDSEGNPVASNPSVAKAQAKKADKVTDDPTKVTVTVTTDEETAAESGEYTLEVLLSSNAKTKQSATFNIAGPAASIELSADPAMGTMIGEHVSVTATVTDDAGVGVPDGTSVRFSTTSGGGVALISAADASTKDGVATATLGVSGSGTTFVYAISGEASGTLTFESTAGGDAADRAPSLSDFANNGMPGTTAWLGPDAQASDLLALLAGRASAIWLSNGETWVLYAMTGDGAMVPGSVNFSVTAGSVLYISN